MNGAIMKKTTLVFVTDTKTVVSVAINYIFTKFLLNIIKVIKTVRDFDEVLCELRTEFFADCPENPFIGSMPTPHDGIFVVDCNDGNNFVENIKSDIVIFLNRSGMQIEVNQYVGDFVRVNNNEMLIFTGSVNTSKIIKMK